MELTTIKQNTGIEGVAEFIDSVMERKETDKSVEKEGLSSKCVILAEAICDFAAERGYAFVEMDLSEEEGEARLPSPAALERLFWKTYDDVAFHCLVSKRFPMFQSCLLPMEQEFHGLQSPLGVLFWGAKNSTHGLSEEDYHVVELSYRYVCDALSPMTSALQVFIEMANQRWPSQKWDTSSWSNSDEDAIRAAHYVSSEFSMEMSAEEKQKYMDKPDVWWRQKVYPALCGISLVNLHVNNKPSWKDALGPVMALEIDLRYRLTIISSLASCFSNVQDFVDLISVVGQQFSDDDMDAVYRVVGRSLLRRSISNGGDTYVNIAE